MLLACFVLITCAGDLLHFMSKCILIHRVHQMRSGRGQSRFESMHYQTQARGSPRFILENASDLRLRVCNPLFGRSLALGIHIQHLHEDLLHHI